MERLVIASNNQGKIKEIKTILGGFYKEILSMREAGVNIEVEEDGSSFYENAAKKAIEISKLLKGDVLADDSGLCVDALLGAPGIYSARYAGDGATDEQNNKKLLAEIKDKTDRTARFVCALVLARDGKELLCAEGSVEGVIIDEEKGDGGFGYDPLFYVGEIGMTFGEAPSEIKNVLSHRAKALLKMKELIEKL